MAPLQKYMYADQRYGPLAKSHASCQWCYSKHTTSGRTPLNTFSIWLLLPFRYWGLSYLFPKFLFYTKACWLSIPYLLYIASSLVIIDNRCTNLWFERVKQVSNRNIAPYFFLLMWGHKIHTVSSDWNQVWFRSTSPPAGIRLALFSAVRPQSSAG